MIRGLDLFREHFADYRKAFVLIGGVACHEWLSTQGLAFRATKDMDMVLIVEALDASFVKRFWEFIEAGKYRGRYKAEDGRQLYRFDEREEGKGKDIAKHRNDVFRIAATLPGEAGPTIPGAVQEDLRKFLATFPVENKEAWQAIGDGLKTTFGSRKLKPDSLIEAIRAYFKL